MNKQDWIQLDKLLGQDGFGGYYDLVECLRDCAEAWAREKLREEDLKSVLSKIQQERTLSGIVGALTSLARFSGSEK